MRTYTYGLERISELQSVNNTPTASFYQYDGRGTVRMLTSAAGAVTDSYAYDAFGNLIAQTGSTPNVYLYRGERFDADLGLYYLRARWYNPATGRFMTRDPYEGSIYDPASLHRYNYARANPVNYVDPSGRNALMEISLDTLGTIGDTVAVYRAGKQLACVYYAEASMLKLIFDAPFANGEQMQLESAQLKTQIGECGAQVTWVDLLAFGLGPAARGFGELFGDFEEGFPFPCRLCFAAGTPVHTDHGAVPIEKIKVGDKVWARNERTGATELRTVTAVAPQHFDKLMELRVAGEKSALHPTPTHPFWARRNASEPAHWIDAGDLVAGEQIETQDGRWLTIESVVALDKPAVVYNFTVAEDHDYFVGEQGLLVHNAGPDLSGFDASGRPLSSPYYSVWNQTTMPESMYSASRGAQNQYANEQLYNAMQDDPQLAQALGQGVENVVQPGARGAFSRSSPPDMSWNHNAEDPTMMELIPRAQHQAPGPVQNSLHPNQEGGFKRLQTPCE